MTKDKNEGLVSSERHTLSVSSHVSLELESLYVYCILRAVDLVQVCEIRNQVNVNVIKPQGFWKCSPW